MGDEKSDGTLRIAIERRVAELRDEHATCESVAIRIFVEEFGILPEEALHETLARTSRMFGGPQCSCQPLRIAMLALGILGSRAASPGPSEPIQALNSLEKRFRDTCCPACHAEYRVGGHASVPMATSCTDALVNGVLWVRELATERDWI